MKTVSYRAIIFRQRSDSPLQVSFAAPSSDIDMWARVPTKKTANVRNFQRAQIPRHINEVEKFFRDKHNASPTAVVVGFDPIRAKGRVTTKIDGKPINPETISAGVPELGEIEITLPEIADPQTRDDFIAEIQTHSEQLQQFIFAELKDIVDLSKDQLIQIGDIISDQLKAGIEPEDEKTNGDESDENQDMTSSDDSLSSTDLAVPGPVRDLLVGLSPSEQQVVAGRMYFLKSLDSELLNQKSQEELEIIYEEVWDELKPGILIDGQHRVMGTKKGGSIPFLVTALPDAPWAELAFQFIVTNRTARRVPESLLISIVGNSLSRIQRNEIESRLLQAGIRVGLIEAVMQVHEDVQSPFYEMVAFGIKGEKGFLDAAAMRGKVIQVWYERRPPIRELFDHLCQGKRIGERTEYWQDQELWFQYFCAFWASVRDRYRNSDVFSKELEDPTLKKPVSRLMTATVLGVFQDTILKYLRKYLDNKANTDGIPIAVSLPNENKFRDLVTNTLQRLTPEFFQGWTLSGFDGSKGVRDDLAEAITLVIDGTLTVAQLKKQDHRLFKKE